MKSFALIVDDSAITRDSERPRMASSSESARSRLTRARRDHPEELAVTSHPGHVTLRSGNGLCMHILEEGKGPLVVLLHGFPEFSGTWRHQLRALAAAGYRPSAYTISHLVGDVICLLDALDEAQAVVVGHDRRAAVPWQAALLRPDRVRASQVRACRATRVGRSGPPSG